MIKRVSLFAELPHAPRRLENGFRGYRVYGQLLVSDPASLIPLAYGRTTEYGTLAALALRPCRPRLGID